MNAMSLIGSILDDRYRVLEMIGDGGMGEVFRAEQLATGQPVALKLLHPEFAGTDEVVQRFEREAKVTAQLVHPNIVKVIEFGQSNGRLFLAMELLAGRSLAQLIERDGGARGRLTVKRANAIMRPVLDALDYAHERGVVHRDLKPDNIMIVPGSGLLARETVKLLDFGVAKLRDRSGQSNQKLTQQGLVLGTPSYMSPEQAVGQEADVRSDIYSCGVMLYQMLTGHRPFEADSSLDVLAMHLNVQPRSLRTVAPDARIPGALDDVVLRALAKRPPDRFQSARELRQALERAIGHGSRTANISGVEPTILATARPRQATGPWMRLAVVVAALALALGHHLQPRSAAGGRRVASSETGDSARKSRAMTRPEAPGPPRERPRTGQPSPSSSQRVKPNVTHRGAKSKKGPGLKQ